MITVTKQENGVLFTFTNSDKYLYGSGTIEVPFNSLSIIQDESDNITLRKSASNDIFLSARYDTDFGYASKEAAVEALKEILYDEAGISEEEVQEMIDAATSGIPSSEVVEQLRRDVNAVSGEVDTKQDILTAGENITISGNVISADAGNNIIELTQAEYDALETKDPEALYIITDAQEINMNDYYTKSEVDASINTKADASALTAVNNALTAHTANTEVHVTQAEKNTWNGKVDEGYVTDYAYSKNQIDGFLENATTLLQTISGEVDTKVDTTTYESGQYATAQALNALQENKLDASAYTPTDLSEYWTSGQTQEAINAATSGIPSSQVIEQLQTDVSNLWGETNDIWDTIDEKEEVIASALTQLNQDVAEIDAKEEVIASALTEVNLTLDNKLDASAYTPTDLSEYWTSAQTQSAIDAATSGIPSSQVIEALRSDLNTVSGEVENKQDALQFYGEYTDQWEETDGETPDSTAVFTQKQSDIYIEDSGDEGNSQACVQTRVDTVKFNGVIDTGHSGSLVNIYANESSNETTEYGSSIEVSDNGVGIKSSFIDYDDESSERLTSINMNHNDVSISLVSTANGDSTAMVINTSGVTINDERVLTEGDVDNALNSGSTNPVQNAVITQALDNKLDASAYTPTDLSNYYTTGQTDALLAAKADTATTYTKTEVDNALSSKADASAVTAVSNDLNALSGAVIDNEYTVSQAINSLNNRVTAVESGGTGGGITSGEVQTMIDDSLDIYWTSAQTQTAIDGVKAYYVNGNVWLTQGITDADWDGLIAAMNAHRPINATIAQTLYTCESIYLESATILWFTASDGANLYSYRIEKNGSNDYALTYNTKTVAELSEVQALSENINSVNSSLTAHTADTTVHVTQAEKNVWNTKQDALTAGRGILINAGFISTPTAVLGQGGTVGVMQIIKLTQASYDALATKDAQTLYIVVD